MQAKHIGAGAAGVGGAVTWTKRATSGATGSIQGFATNGTNTVAAITGSTFGSEKTLDGSSITGSSTNLYTLIGGGYGMDFGNALFMEVGTNTGGTGPRLVTSSDGLTWSTHSTFSTVFSAAPENAVVPSCIKFCGGTNWIAAGDKGVMCYSTDSGTTWTKSTSTAALFASAYQVKDIATNGSNVFLLVGDGPKSAVCSTINGTYTSAGVESVISAGYTITGAAYSPTLGRFVAIAIDFSGNAMAAYSSNGTSWTVASSFATAYNPIKVQYSSGNSYKVRWSSILNKFVAGMFGGVLTSSDGITWTSDAALKALSDAVGGYAFTTPTVECSSRVILIGSGAPTSYITSP